MRFVKIKKEIIKKYQICPENIDIFNRIEDSFTSVVFINTDKVRKELKTIVENNPQDLNPYFILAQKTVLENSIAENLFKILLTEFYYSNERVPSENNYWENLSEKSKKDMIKHTLEYQVCAVNNLLKIKELSYEDILVSLLEIDYRTPIPGRELLPNMKDIMGNKVPIDYSKISNILNPLKVNPDILGYFLLEKNSNFDISKIMINCDVMKNSQYIKLDPNLPIKEINAFHFFEIINVCYYINKTIKYHDKLLKDPKTNKRPIYDSLIKKYSSPFELLNTISKDNPIFTEVVKQYMKDMKPILSSSEQIQFWTNLELSFDLNSNKTKDNKLKI